MILQVIILNFYTNWIIDIPFMVKKVWNYIKIVNMALF